MQHYHLSQKELEAFRIVYEALLLDEDISRNYFERYKTGGLMGLLDDKYLGKQGWVSEAEMRI